MKVCNNFLHFGTNCKPKQLSMFRHFISLEWKAFFRSASYEANLALKIVMGLMALIFMVFFAMMGFAVFFVLKDEFYLEPLATVNKYLIYYIVGDLVLRYFFQKMPVTNIKPLLNLPISRNVIVHFSLWKTAISFFNVFNYNVRQRYSKLINSINT